jgi:hypothetical protein
MRSTTLSRFLPLHDRLKSYNTTQHRCLAASQPFRIDQTCSLLSALKGESSISIVLTLSTQHHPALTADPFMPSRVSNKKPFALISLGSSSRCATVLHAQRSYPLNEFTTLETTLTMSLQNSTLTHLINLQYTCISAIFQYRSTLLQLASVRRTLTSLTTLP